MKRLVLVAVVALASCTHLTPVEVKLLNCGQQAIQQQLPNLLQQVNGILSSPDVNWQDGLNALLMTAGDALVCAVQVAVAQLEHGAVSNDQVKAVALVRGEAWLAANTR